MTSGKSYLLDFDKLYRPLGRRPFWRQSSREARGAGWVSDLISRPGLPTDLSFSWSPWRGVFLLLTTTIGFLVVFSRLFVLQVVDGAENRFASDNNRLRVQAERASRGVIFDRNGNQLASNAPGFQLIWQLSEETPDWAVLGRLIGKSEESLRALVDEARGRGAGSVVLSSNLSRDAVVLTEVAFSSFPGLRTEVAPIRHYPFDRLFSHVLGYVGEVSPNDLVVGGFGSRVGKTGLEREFDLLLRGRDGSRLLEVDVTGSGLREVAVQPAEPGRDLYTSLDLGLQQISYEVLLRGMSRAKATAGVVVAQRPQSGEVLALVSVPDFSPGQLASGLRPSDFIRISEDPSRPLFNRAVSGTYPPGSVFKLITASAALAEGVVTASDIIDCRGSISVGSFSYGDWVPGGHGRISLLDALGKSCDVYFYIVGGGYGGRRGVGAEALAHYARLYGLGEITGIEQSFESQGVVPDPEWKLKARGEAWYTGNTYHFAIGQGDVLVTPLQINNITSAIANGGNLLEPTLLLGNSPQLLRTGFISEDVLTQIREGMRRALRPGGTAYPFFDFPLTCGGKTGTSETGQASKTHAWFTIFAPMENPEIALTVFLENGGEGSRDAAPLAREILNWYFKLP